MPYKTKTGARRAINEAHNPCLVALPDGKYDAYPLGHPLPKGATVIERCVLTASGMKWRKAEAKGVR